MSWQNHGGDELREDSLQYLCCPLCHGDLTLNLEKIKEGQVMSGFLRCEVCKREYKVEDGLPDFLLTEFLNKTDKKWMLEYDAKARSYDIIMCFLTPLFSVGLEPFERYMWVKRLQIRKGANVLDVSTGTGRNLSFIIRQIGSKGRLAAMDISKQTLAYAKVKIKRKRWKNIELQRANASHLPYKDDTFDAVMHVGGINTFGEKKRALDEMIRVAKRNAKVIVVDEGLAIGREKTFLGKFLLKSNALYAYRPPIGLLPNNIKDLQVSWKTMLAGPVIAWPHYIVELRKA
jgi:ubiquinone/menaquinone biosynthesis C-methylase UbiE